MTDTHAGADAVAEQATVDPAVFARRYLAHAGSQLAGRDSEALDEHARDALAFGRVRPWGQTLLQVVDLDGETTAIDIVSVDAPYIIESLVAELERSGHPPE